MVISTDRSEKGLSFENRAVTNGFPKVDPSAQKRGIFFADVAHKILYQQDLCTRGAAVDVGAFFG